MSGPTARAKLALGLFLLAAFLLCCHAAALGQSPNQTVRLRLSAADLVLLARVAANEDSRPLRPRSDGGTAGWLTEDTLAIAQTVRGFARWARVGDAEALRRLAPHVSGRRPATNPRHLAYAALPASGLARPSAWSEGDWSDYAGNWAAFRDQVREVARRGFDPPCERDPVAWGGAMDEHIARARGLVRLRCGDANTFWAYPPAAVVVPAALASGRP